jgi:hypothetical protein
VEGQAHAVSSPAGSCRGCTPTGVFPFCLNRCWWTGLLLRVGRRWHGNGWHGNGWHGCNCDLIFTVIPRPLDEGAKRGGLILWTVFVRTGWMDTFDEILRRLWMHARRAGSTDMYARGLDFYKVNY